MIFKIWKYLEDHNPLHNLSYDNSDASILNPNPSQGVEQFNSELPKNVSDIAENYLNTFYCSSF